MFGSALRQSSISQIFLKWTAENLGARQSRLHRDTLVQAIGKLTDGPDVAGSKAESLRLVLPMRSIEQLLAR